MTLLRLIHKAILYALYFLFAAPFSLFCMATAPLVVYLFMDRKTYALPKYLKWYEPVDTDNFCMDTMWRQEHPTWSDVKVCYTFLQRNPSYGLLAYLSCKPSLKYSTFGNLDINDNKGIAGWFFILGEEGQFQFRFIYPLTGIIGTMLAGGLFGLVTVTVSWLSGFYSDAAALYAHYPMMVFAVYFYLKNRKSCIEGDWGWQLKSTMHKTYCNLQLAPVRFYGFGVEK